jgi:hypothetical protein
MGSCAALVALVALVEGVFHAGTSLRVAFHAFVVPDVDIVSACRSQALLSWIRDI